MKIINGEKIASAIRKELKEKTAKLQEKPGLAIILIGDDLGSHTYVRLKEKAGNEVGIYFEKHIFSATVQEEKIVSLIEKLNKQSNIHGIVVQFPLPKGLSKEKIITVIDTKKDVDGFHPENIKAFLAGEPCIIPGLSAGIMRLIESTGEQLDGKKALVIANSKVFSGPLGHLLEQRGVVASACRPDKQDCQPLSAAADILIIAIGQPGFLKGEMIKPGAIVIDVGYNRIRGKIVGDVDFESVKKKAAWITPVPGGVGPMTVAMLLNNVLKAYELQK
jgi:methylenetetrahydrofolate dehydrogenase (NADP+)/methenyltetrahydrofolate cyclohydrolase